MTRGSTLAPFRHLETGAVCPVLPKDVCPEALAAHHRPRHCLPVPATSGGPVRRPRHRKRVPADVDPAPSRRWSYATTVPRTVTR